MNIADVLKEKNELLLELERSKLANEKRAVVGQLASKAAAMEADLAAHTFPPEGPNMP